MSENFDVIVIGAGPAGYVAAIRCAQLGFKTACIDKFVDPSGSPSLGGTCANVGCIPSKALLEVSHNYTNTKNDLSKQGIDVYGVKFDLKKVMSYKDSVVKKLTSGVAMLLKANNVTSIHGTAKLLTNQSVEVTDNKNNKTNYQAKNVILAIGSTPIECKDAKYHKDIIVDSTGALSFNEVPKRLAIMGAGVIGLELGSVWARFGSEVVIFEAMDEFLPMADKDIAKDLKKNIEKNTGIKIELGTKVTNSTTTGNSVKVTYEKDGEISDQEFDKLIVAIGRIPNTNNVVDPSVGLKLDTRGFVEVDKYCATNIPNIYAIGDMVRGPMLAHKGSEEGVMVAERLAGKKTELNYDTIPNVVYTSPEVAWVGKTEDELKKEGIPYKTGSFPMIANGRSLAHNDVRGLIKIIAHEQTDTILGVHISAADASELIAQAVISMNFTASSEDIGLIMFAHPSVSETFHEAALALQGHAIHTVNRKK